VLQYIWAYRPTYGEMELMIYKAIRVHSKIKYFPIMSFLLKLDKRCSTGYNLLDIDYS
jgi:hypothetical protein